MTSKPYEMYESGEYLANNPSWDEEDSEWKADKVLKIFDRNNISPESIVEVGCGAGGILAKLHDALPKVAYAGFDIAPEVCKFWIKHSPKIKFSVGDFLQEQTSHYDALLLLDVIEHVPNPFEFLLALHGRADYYVFHIPLDLSASTVLREQTLILGRKKVGHIHYFTKGIALALLDECGYQIVDWSYTGAAFTVPRNTWKGLMIRPFRRLLFALNRDLGVRMLGGDTLIVLAKVR